MKDPCQINCNECHKELEAALCDIPSAWRKQIVEYFCKFVDRGICCTDVIKCINNEMEQLDFSCIAESQTEWVNLTFIQKLQRIIDRICDILDGQIGPNFEARSDSLVITPGGTQGHEPRIELVPSDDPDNILTFGSDGLPYVPSSEDLCDKISNLESLDQLNGLDQDYGFVLSNCNIANPPTAFALQGPNRKSAYGNMEWYNTLLDANADVVGGESILMFNNTDDTINTVLGVTYIGLGNIEIDSVNVVNACKFVNVNIKHLDVTSAGFLEGIGLNVTETANIEGEAFGITTNTNLVRVVGYGKLYNSILRGPVELENNATLDNCNVYNNSDSNYAIFALTTDINSSVTVSNCSVESNSTVGIFARAEGADSTLNIINNTSKSVDGAGIAIQTSKSIEIFTCNIIGNTGSSVNGPGIYIEGAVQLDEVSLRNSLNYWNIFNNNGFSKNAEGILVYSARLTSCKGSSISGPGIKLLGEISRNVGLVDCIGESYKANGLLCSTNCFINGGTYISYRNIKGPLASPIYLDGLNTSNTYILNVTTISRDNTEYAIRASAATSVKIINCTMTSESGLTSAGIDPLITNTASATHVVDVYGNFK
jgi:hypothetical protein